MMIKPSSRVGTKKRLWPGVIQVRGASFGRRDDRIRTCDPLILFASLMTCDGAVTPSLTCGCGSCRLPSSLVFRRCRVARMWHVLAVGDPGLSLQVGAFSPSRRPGVARSRRVKGAPWHQPPPDEGTAPLTRRDSPRGGRWDGETCPPTDRTRQRFPTIPETCPPGEGMFFSLAAAAGSPGLCRTAARDRRQPHARVWRFDRMRAG